MDTVEYERMFSSEVGHWWYEGLHRLIIGVAREERRRLGRGLDILDAGCGTGRLCQLLEPLGAVSGCDLHGPALVQAAGRGVRRLFECDISSEAVGEADYDLITCIDVLYHRRVSGEDAALGNLHRALRAGGLLVLQVPAFEVLRGAHDVAVHTRRRYRPGEVAKMLRAAGFAAPLVTCRLCALFPVMLAWRLFSRARTGQSDLAGAAPRGLIHRVLLGLVRSENALIAAGVRFPLGSSVFALARK